MGAKMKTHKGLTKRFKVTGKGKVKARRPNTSHLLSHMSGKRKRHLRLPLVISNNAVSAKIKHEMGA